MFYLRSNKIEKKTIALDFDGVLHTYTSSWHQDGYPPNDPISGSLDFVNWLLKSYEVVIFSCSARTKKGRLGIEKWLKEHDFPSLEVVSEKPIAEMYIDDRGYRFEGNFDSVREFISDGINPWYK